jgi:hypothetical protein
MPHSFASCARGHWLIYRSCSRPLYVNDGDCHPGFERPLHRTELPGYYTALESQIRVLKLKLNRWAVAPGCCSSSGRSRARSPGNRSSCPTLIVLRFAKCSRPKASHISTIWRYVHLQSLVSRDSGTCQSEMSRRAIPKILDRCVCKYAAFRARDQRQSNQAAF